MGLIKPGLCRQASAFGKGLREFLIVMVLLLKLFLKQLLWGGLVSR